VTTYRKDEEATPSWTLDTGGGKRGIRLAVGDTRTRPVARPAHTGRGFMDTAPLQPMLAFFKREICNEFRSGIQDLPATCRGREG